MTKPKRLRLLDELFLHLEGPNTHMHVGAVTVFDGPPPTYQEFLDQVTARLKNVPRFRQKLLTVPFGLGRPLWVDDTHFNPEYHLRHTALPSPGNHDKLRALASRIMSQQLDRSKPLWEMWFVEGLGGDQWGIISKTHHSLVDGVSGADLFTVIMDLTPEPEEVEPERWIPDPEPTADALVIDALKEFMISPREAFRNFQSAILDPSTLPNRAYEAVRAMGSFVGGTLDFAPESSLNVPIGPHRRFETVLADLDEFKRIKNSLGGTVNDVVLTVVTGALRSLMRARGEQVGDMKLRAMIPVSVRADADKGALGNQVASVWAELPVYEEDPHERFDLVHEEMKNLKSGGQAVGAKLLTSVGEFAPPTILAQASRLVARQRAFNLVVTNVPGPQFPLYSFGREMKELYPVVPLSDNTSVCIGLMSYNGMIGFGLLGDYDSASDIGVLAEGLEKSIAELTALTA